MPEMEPLFRVKLPLLYTPAPSHSAWLPEMVPPSMVKLLFSARNTPPPNILAVFRVMVPPFMVKVPTLLTPAPL